MLWRVVFIDMKGDVYPCCHRKTGKIGNIYLQNIKDMYNNDIIQDLRRKSLNGQLECFFGCNLFNQEIFNMRTSLDRRRIESMDNPLIADLNAMNVLQVLFGTRCNIHCIMCGQNHENEESLDREALIKAIHNLSFKMTLIIGGEPLAIPNAKLFFDQAASLNLNPAFSTNGSLIDEEWAKKIALYSPVLTISINAATKKTHEFINRGSRWESVIHGIRRVCEARERYHTHVRILGHMTILPANINEIALFVRIFQLLGFDAIEFGFDESVPEYLRQHPIRTFILRLQIRKSIKASKDPAIINTNRLKCLGLV
jgi:MoaA/NifB/PqqE/SkfB family radical SAM enzyme